MPPEEWFLKVKVLAFVDDEVVVFEDKLEVVHNVGVHRLDKRTYLYLTPRMKQNTTGD